ncbi:MAG: ATP-dependent Clp protease ATP-binding subunit ClpA [Cyanobacteria bacterium TGS_CYA1]|nr:ATP-dependent Clp protease ATP-binding subunit ClpA [Cyanobacteria bacterium TGS_CYA1]
MLTQELEKAINNAANEAIRRRHEYLTLEHLLLALLDDKVGKEVITKCGGKPKAMKKELIAFMDETYESMSDSSEYVLSQTASYERIFQRAVIQARSSGQANIDAGNILAAFFDEKRSYATYLLESHGISRLDILSYISHGITKNNNGVSAEYGDNEHIRSDGAGGGEDEEEEQQLSAIEAFCTNLLEKAANKQIDHLVGREKEVNRVIQILARRRKNNPLLVGEAGVGKTAIAEGLALKIHNGDVPKALQTAEVYGLEMSSILAGAAFKGEMEKRLKQVIAELHAKPGAILFIDEIQTIVGAGKENGSFIDAASILKPALASGSLRCIGSTTFQDYKQSVEKDKALARRFEKVEVVEPSIEETMSILRGLKHYYEDHHKVTYSDEIITAIAELAAKHINEKFLPDKAIDVMDEVGAHIKLRPENENKTAEVTLDDVESIVASIARVPVKSVSAKDKVRLQNLESELKAVIYGQDHAIEQIVKIIKLSRSGLGNLTKPIGSFLFSGPTGVGKTELAKQLAKIQGIEMIRFDMSEFSEKHTVSRLIGAPPGYVGYDQGGQLTDAVIKHPHCVILLDEIEKAHFDLYNILLQVMDHAALTDNFGKKADFRNVILIMTTNAGAREMTSLGVGFQPKEDDTTFGAKINMTPGKSRGKEAIERTFSPEFRNRLDAWVVFNQLTVRDIKQVVDKFVGEVTKQLEAKKVKLTITDAAVEWFTKNGFDKLYGARPMGRLIQQKLREPLSEELLFGKLQNGGSTEVDAKDNEIVINCTEAKE